MLSINLNNLNKITRHRPRRTLRRPHKLSILLQRKHYVFEVTSVLYKYVQKNKPCGVYSSKLQPNFNVFKISFELYSA